MVNLNLRLETNRLVLVPYNDDYLQDYFNEFTEEITKYQYPDKFNNIDDTRNLLAYFVDVMEKGKMLELVILSKDGEFLGSIEAHGLDENYPVLGLWLKSKAHGNGYGYEALKCLIDYLNSMKAFENYIYESDKRNLQSLCLVKKFTHKEDGYEEIITESGKKLNLLRYLINN